MLDADDWMEPGRLATLLGVARRTSADIVADNLWLDIGGQRSLLIVERLDGECDAIDPVAYVLDNRPTKPGTGLGFLKPVFSAPFLKRHGLRYDQSLRIGEDFLLVAEMLARGCSSIGDVGQLGMSIASISVRYRIASARRRRRRWRPRTSASSLNMDAAATQAFRIRKAMKSHLASTREAAAFARFVEAIKRKRWSDATAEAVRRPSVLAMLQEPLRARFTKARARSLRSA